MIELVDLIDEHGPEIEYDLIRCGLRLRDFPSKRLTWGDLKTVIVQCQARTESALWRKLHPDEWMWDMTPSLLATLIDEMRYLGYMYQLAHGVKGIKPPKPIPRPGVSDTDAETIGKEPLPMDEMAEWLGGPFAALNN